jgi:GNAT superfamily N-acetyltransferase
MELGDYGRGAASLTLTPMDGLAPDEIDRVRVIVKLRTDPAHRRKGHATRLLKEICYEADTTGTVLVIEPAPFEDEPHKVGQLAHFYRRFGFETLQTEPRILMARKAKERHGRTSGSPVQ